MIEVTIIYATSVLTFRLPANEGGWDLLEKIAPHVPSDATWSATPIASITHLHTEGQP